MDIPEITSDQPIPEHAKRVFKGVIFDVYQWEQELYDGRKKLFEKLKRPNTVVVIPVMEDGTITICTQEQPGIAQPFLSCISGRQDEGETPLETAKRELLEEAGLEANDWRFFDVTSPMSKIDWGIYTFIAKGCKKVAEQDLDGGEKIELRTVSFEAFAELNAQNALGELRLQTIFLEAKLDPAKMEAIKKRIIQ